MDTNSRSSAKTADDGVSLNVLRGQALRRLAGVQERLEGMGVSAAFIRAAKPDPLGDMGFLSGMIFSMMLGGPFAHFLGMDAAAGQHHGLTDGFNGVAAATEGLSLVRDMESGGLRGRRFNDYPEGRRNCALHEAKMSKRFNLVSANQNNRLSFNAQAEMACMFEIIDMLDKLSASDVQGLRLGDKEAVYDVLKQVSRGARSKDVVKNLAAPVPAAA